jgi:hypothetical protein
MSSVKIRPVTVRPKSKLLRLGCSSQHCAPRGKTGGPLSRRDATTKFVGRDALHFPRAIDHNGADLNFASDRSESSSPDGALVEGDVRAAARPINTTDTRNLALSRVGFFGWGVVSLTSQEQLSG